MRSTNILALAAAALAEVHIVEVGENGLKFVPDTVTAAVGDTVVFKLYPQHDVAQASFDAPCVPSSGGFYSGPYSGTDSGKKKWVYNVTSTDPIYYYCSIPSHCESGMVGGINLPSSGNTLAAFAEAAKNATTQRPTGESGGQLEEDEQLASLTASAGDESSSTSAPASSGTGAAASTTAASGSAASGTATATGGGSSGSATPTASGSGSGTAAASTPSSTGAADSVKAPVTGVLAAALGFAAWLL